MYKLPKESQFIDLSDYARPWATRLVQFLLPYTFITAITVTWLFTIVGFVSAILIWQGKWLFLAALLLPVKSLLDAADGSLARARKQPSQVGRFLDSFCDFFVNLALFLAIAHQTEQPGGYALLALIAATFQGSVYNYYYVIKRHDSGGDLTSVVNQRKMPEPFPGDSLSVLKFLHSSYLFLYWWQDRLAYWLDPDAIHHSEKLTGGFLTAVSALGLGFQLLMICFLMLSHSMEQVFFYFTVVAMVYALMLVGYRRIALS